MERSFDDYDEVISDMLIQLAKIEKQIDVNQQYMDKMNKRIDFVVKRMVKAENRMELFDQKLEQSIKDQKEFSRIQSKMNEYFLSVIKKNGKK